MPTDPASLAHASVSRLNARDYDGWRHLLAPDFQMVYAAAIHGEVLTLAFSAEEVLQAQTELDVAFPDLERTITHVVQTQTEAAVFLQLSGTHLGPYKGAAPTYRRITEVVSTRCLVANGHIQRCYVYRSPHHLRGELGLWYGELHTEPPDAE